MPKVSIVMPSFNLATYQVETLDSTFRQNFDDFEMELIVDYSTDDTKVAVRGCRR